MIVFPYTVPALKVEQPLGIFYVAILPAELLLLTAFSDKVSARAIPGKNEYCLDGTQRAVQDGRLTQIATYIRRVDAAFPNAIILAANYRIEDGRIEDAGDEGNGVADHSEVIRSWAVTDSDDGICTLTIPTGDKLAAIIDGQHRLFAFTRTPEEHGMLLICSVFLDLPKPYQAQLFATINSTQKRVDKSLTYELFGYNIEDESAEFWSPDKLAVFITRRLNIDENSPLHDRIIIAPKKDSVLEDFGKRVHKKGETPWRISTAVVVEGVMRLFTSNPKADSTKLMEKSKKTRASLPGLRSDKSPLRSAYVDVNDELIEKVVVNFLTACKELFWENAPENSYILKTIGVQALFDVLRMWLIQPALDAKDISVAFFKARLEAATEIDFANTEFRNLSGAGRSYMRRKIETALNKSPTGVA